MPSPLVCLVGFALWALVLVLAIGATRVSQVLAGTKRANEFPSGMQHGGDRYWRLNRAHVNAVENLPIFAAIILAGTWLHVDGRIFLTLPVVVLGARVVQSITHITSGSSRAVSLRFAAFLLQVTCNVVLAVEVLRRAI